MTGHHPLPPPTPRFAGTPPFPEAARAALGDRQLRANLHDATATIRAKRAQVVAERDDWEELRLSGAAIKDRTLASAELRVIYDRTGLTGTSGGGQTGPQRPGSAERER